MYQCTLSKTVHLHGKRSSICFLFWHFEWCLRLTVKPSMEKHIALHSQPLSQSSTYQQLPEPCCIWMQPPLAQQWPIWWLISSSVMRLWRTSQSASALRQCGTHVCQPLSSATTTMYILQKPHSGRKSPLLENCLQVDDTVAQPPTVPCSLLLLLSAVPSFGLELQLWKFPLSLKICREGHTSSFLCPWDTQGQRTERLVQPTNLRVLHRDTAPRTFFAPLRSWGWASRKSPALQPLSQSTEQ